LDTDRNLLFGVLAVNVGLIDAQRFTQACADWATRKEVALGDILVERGWITPEEHEHIRWLLERDLAKHQGNARLGLGAAAGVVVLEAMLRVPDDEVRKSVYELAPLSASEAEGPAGPVDDAMEIGLGLVGTTAGATPPRPPRSAPGATPR
jgi:hypothetical protein